jgi:acetyl-CoA C-acetyltransferase
MNRAAPVIAGAGQVSGLQGASPLELMREAALAADSDAGGGVLDRVQSIGVLDCLSWPVPDPGALLASELNLSPRETVRTIIGGNGPIALLGDLCARITSGELETALLVGGEAVNPFMRAMRAGEPTGWPEQPEGTAPARIVGEDRPPSHEVELGAGLIAPIVYYPWFENAVRAAAGRDVDEHRTWLGRLWSRFADVARDNPYAWTREAPADPAATADGNRMAAFPYPKLLTANIQVDQAAALLLRGGGDGVHVHATATAEDVWFPGERHELHRSPAIAAAGGAVFEHTGAGLDDFALLDLYSCFPSAVQIAATELGLHLENDPRPPTVTGGLTFAGGPGNNYVTHALATLTRKLRERPDTLALATGVGWYMTKHGAAVLGSREPARPFADLYPEPDRRSRGLVGSGSGTLESYTVTYERDGTPATGIVSALADDGRRVIGTADPASLLDGDPIGRAVSV